MKARICVYAVALSLLVGLPLLADGVNLPGHTLSAKDARQRANIVFIGQLVSLDPVKTKSGTGEYLGKVIYASRPANGIHTSYVTTQNTTAHIPAIPSDLGIPMAMTVAPGETAPEVGKSYVFYAKDNTQPGGSGYDALKLAPTSEFGSGVRGF